MIKLENPTNAPVALSVLTLQSVGSAPSIVLSTDNARKLQGEIWVEDPARLKQFVSFTAPDGEQAEIEGLVDENSAVEISGAFKVVLEVSLRKGLKGAFDKGAVSRGYAAVELVRVVEVWSTPSKKLWSAQNLPESGPGKSFDPSTGKVS